MMALMPIACSESSIQIISFCCFSVLPTASADGQSIFATVAIHAPLKPTSAFKVQRDKVQSTKVNMYLKTLNSQFSILNPPSFYVEYSGVFVGFEYFRKVLAVGIGNEDLAELITLYHFHDTLHPLGVQTVEDII